MTTVIITTTASTSSHRVEFQSFGVHDGEHRSGVKGLRELPLGLLVAR
jgi:hypothetical protein